MAGTDGYAKLLRFTGAGHEPGPVTGLLDYQGFPLKVEGRVSLRPLQAAQLADLPWINTRAVPLGNLRVSVGVNRDGVGDGIATSSLGGGQHAEQPVRSTDTKVQLGELALPRKVLVYMLDCCLENLWRTAWRQFAEFMANHVAPGKRSAE